MLESQRIPSPSGNSRDQNKASTLAILVLICLLAVCVRLVNISALSVWFDEGFSIGAAVQPTLSGVVLADPSNPPAYYLMLRTAIWLFGDSDFSLRWVSVMLGIILVAVCYRFANRLFGDRAGIYVAVLVALSPPLWWASREIRMYAMMAILLTTMAYVWMRLAELPANGAQKQRLWVLLWLSEGLLLYTHTIGPIAALWVNAVTLIAWLVRRNSTRPDWRIWMVGQAGLFVLWLPWLLFRFVLVRDANQVVAAPPAVGLSLLSTIWQAFWAGNWDMVNHESLLGIGALAAACVTLILIPWRSRAARWQVLHVIVLLAGLLAGLTVVRIGLHGRYLVMIVPLVLVLIAGGLAQWRWGGKVVATLLILPLVAVSAWSIAVAAEEPAYQHDAVALMAQYYARNLSDQDTVLAWSYADRYDLAYYWTHLGVTARRITLLEGQDSDVVAPLIPRRGKVALNVWFTQRADMRRMMACLLAHGSTIPPAEYTVYGMSDLLYAAPPAELSRLHPVDGDFGVARLTDVADSPSFTADQATCIPLRISLNQMTPRDIKAALIVKNELGWEIARADAIFARADQKTSMHLSPGAVLDAYPLVWLPYGTPPGTYLLAVRLYDDDALSGYDVLGANGAPVGKDLAVGEMHVLSGSDWLSDKRVNEMTATRIETGDGLTLIGQSMSPTDTLTATNGDVIGLSLLWQGTSPLPILRLRSEDGQWEVPVSATVTTHDAVTLDWREARIPAQAPSGRADLVLPDNTVVARYAVTSLPGLFTPPLYKIPVSASWPEVAGLAGMSMRSPALKRSEPFTVSLIWHPTITTPSIGYTVFVQLIDAQGKVTAQSDALPAAGERPTTGWRPGEYIIDTHTLSFKEGAGTGAAKLIAGFYDARTGARAILADGTDHTTLPISIDVQ
jgi:4-amino-4-deoxy-L-arabinose transferase-like glycosyltransferase